MSRIQTKPKGIKKTIVMCGNKWQCKYSPEKRKHERVTQTSMPDKKFRVMVAFGHIDLLLSMHGEGQSNRMIWSAKATGLCCRDILFFHNHGSVENGYITI